MANWFVLMAGTEQGPFTDRQLKQLASEGRLSRIDLVRREDQQKGCEAQKLKGLFEAPPPLPATVATQTPSTGTLVITRLPKSTGLFHSVSVAIDGQYYGSVGGGFPIGLLDFATSKKRSLTVNIPAGHHTVEVAGGLLKNSLSVNVQPGEKHLTTFFSNLGVFGGGLNLAESASSVASIAQPIGTQLPQSPISVNVQPLPQLQPKVNTHSTAVARSGSFGVMAAIGCGAVFLILIVTCAGLSIIGNSSFGQSSDVTFVKNSSLLPERPGVSIDALVNSFFGKPRWTSGKAASGQRLVNVSGDMMYLSKKVKGEIQFFVTDKSLEVSAFEINGVPQNKLITAGLIVKMYEEFDGKRR